MPTSVRLLMSLANQSIKSKFYEEAKFVASENLHKCFRRLVCGCLYKADLSPSVSVVSHRSWWWTLRMLGLYFSLYHLYCNPMFLFYASCVYYLTLWNIGIVFSMPTVMIHVGIMNTCAPTEKLGKTYVSVWNAEGACFFGGRWAEDELILL